MAFECRRLMMYAVPGDRYRLLATFTDRRILRRDQFRASADPGAFENLEYDRKASVLSIE